MAKTYRVTVARTALDKVLDSISPEVAFALGKASSHCSVTEASARILASEELVEPLEGRGYIYTTRVGEMLTKAFEQRISDAYPEQEPEPAPPEQPKAPTFTPTPEPVPLTPTLLACAGCGAPKCKLRYPEKPADDKSNGNLRCADCRSMPTDVKPPGV